MIADGYRYLGAVLGRPVYRVYNVYSGRQRLRTSLKQNMGALSTPD